jgi:hypothetical protein
MRLNKNQLNGPIFAAENRFVFRCEWYDNNVIFASSFEISLAFPGYHEAIKVTSESRHGQTVRFAVENAKCRLHFDVPSPDNRLLLAIDAPHVVDRSFEWGCQQIERPVQVQVRSFNRVVILLGRLRE